MIEISSLAIEKNKSVFIKRLVLGTGKSLAVKPPTGELRKAFQLIGLGGSRKGVSLKFIVITRRYQQMNIRPLQDRVVIRRMEEETTTAGGIVLPGAAAEKPNQGEIVAVGTGKPLDNGETRAMSVSVGDKVVFGQYSGSNTIKVDGEELLIMSESEILGVIEK